MSFVVVSWNKTADTYTQVRYAPPTPVIGLSVINIFSTSATLSWSAESGVTGYNIYDGNTLLTPSPITTTTYDLISLTTNTVYTSYSVTAVNSFGESSKATFSFTTTYNPPSNLQATNITSTAARLTWDVVTGSTGYKIYNGATYVTTVTNNYYDISSLSIDTEYTFNISVLNAGGESTKSPITFRTTFVAPTNLTVLTITSDSATLQWDAVINAISYKIYQGSTYLDSTTLTYYPLSSLSSGTDYTYSVTAISASSSESNKSDISFVTIPAQPLNGSVINITPTTGDLSWDASFGSTGYHIYVNDVLVDTITSTTYPIPSTPLPYSSNKYSVSAYNISGESTKEDIYVPTITPTNLQVSYSGFNVTYSWDANLTGNYRLYSGATLIVETTDTTYTEVNSSEVSKDVKVKSYSSAQLQESPDSNVVTVLTLPNAPTSLVVTDIPTGFTLDWVDNSTHEVGYKIFKRINSGSWNLLNTTTQITYTDTFTAIGGNLYEYQVCAYNSTGDSSFTTSGIEVLDSVTVSALVQDSLNKITYSWNASNSANAYDVHITTNGVSSVVEVTATNYVYTITGETSQSVYVVAKDTYAYGNVVSDNSNTVNTVSSPRNVVTNLGYTITKNGSNYDIDVTFTDKSNIEDQFRVAYSIDDQSYQTVDVLSTTKATVDTAYTKKITIPITSVNSKVNIKVASYNISGLSAYCTPITIVKPTIFQGTWKSGTSEVYFAWKDESTLEQEYKLKYQVNGGSLTTISRATTDGVVSGIFTETIPLVSGSTITATLYPVRNGLEGFPSDVLTVGSAHNVTLVAPTDLTAGWYSDRIAEYTWTDNTNRDAGYHFVYSINGGAEQTIDVQSTSTNSTGNLYSVTVPLTNNLDVITAKVRAYSYVGELGLFTGYIEETYYDVPNPIAPPNFRRVRTGSGVTLSWDAVSYVNHYELTYTINGIISNIETINTYYDIPLDYNNTVTLFSANVKVYYNGGKISPDSPEIAFVPTASSNGIDIRVYNSTEAKYQYIENTIFKINEPYLLSTNTHQIDIKTTVTGFETLTVNQGITDKYYMEEIRFDKTSAKYEDVFVVKNNVISNFYVSQNTILTNIKDLFPLSTNTYKKDLLQTSQSVVLSIKNQGVRSNAQIQFNIWNQEVIQSNNTLVTTSFTRTYNDSEPIHYMIYTKYDISVPIETEIHKIRICTMGDSITAGHPGYWAESGTGRVTSQYQYWLQKRLKSDFEVLNNGYGSDTTLRCLNRFQRDVVDKNPNYVIIQAGTNDIHWALAERKDDQAYLDAKMEQAKANLISMIEMSIANNITPILGTLIPRTSAQGIYRTALLNYNAWIINYCNSREDVFYVDFYNAGKNNIPPTPLEEPSVIGNLNPLYDGDSTFDVYGNLIRRGQGVHPNDTGYRLMGEAVPLSLFKSLASGIQVYIDQECTVEESATVSADTTKVYNMTFKNLNRGRVKVTNRFLKNIGNSAVLYALYATKEIGLDIKFSTDGINYYDKIDGSISAGSVLKVYIQLSVPQFGDTPQVALNVATRSMKVS